MKEFDRPKNISSREEDLTKKAQKSYSVGGGIFMPEQVGGENASGPFENKNPEGSKRFDGTDMSWEKRVILPEQKRVIDEAWKNHNEIRIEKGEKISVEELRSQDIIKGFGYMPPLDERAQWLVKSVRDGGILPKTIVIEKIVGTFSIIK